MPQDIDTTLELWPIDEWMRIRGHIRCNCDGRGKWVSAGRYMTEAGFDLVFDQAPPAAATSIIFFNRWRVPLADAIKPLGNGLCFDEPATEHESRRNVAA